MKFILLLLLLQSCAVVHHVQVGSIKSLKGYSRQPFELMVSETGFNIQELGSFAHAVTKNSVNSKTGSDIKTITDIISLFQMGPTTGKMVFSDKYADGIGKSIYQKCPSGKVTGLVMIRETNVYPVVSGEIIKIRGFCLTKRNI